ncbi:MAG TPA: type VII secretion-associated protein, partial [Pseudonocardiaceae bacterium]
RAVAVDPMRTAALPDQATRKIASVAPPAPLAGVTGPPGRPGPGFGGPPPAQPTRYSAAPARPGTARRGRRRIALLGTTLVVLAAVVVGFLMFGNRHNGSAAATEPPHPSTAGQPSELVAQYDYKFTTPTGWSQSAGNAPNLEVQITPTDNPTGGDAIYVREFRLSYDSTTDRTRAVNELQPEVAKVGYLNFRSKMTFAGRTVAYYQQPGNDASIEWYVLFQGKVQVSVGCQYPTPDQAAVTQACQQVVSGLAITG